MLNLWVSSTSEDMDIFVTLRNIGPDGKDVCEVGQHGQPMPCVTKGWLRASHRKLDPEKSLPYRPYHAHDERLVARSPASRSNARSRSGRRRWCSRRGTSCASTSSRATALGSAPYTHYHADYNAGAENTIHAGGRQRISWIMLPDHSAEVTDDRRVDGLRDEELTTAAVRIGKGISSATMPEVH